MSSFKIRSALITQNALSDGTSNNSRNTAICVTNQSPVLQKQH